MISEYMRTMHKADVEARGPIKPDSRTIPTRWDNTAWIFGYWGPYVPKTLRGITMDDATKDEVLADAREELFSNGGAQDVVIVVFPDGTQETIKDKE